MGSCGNKLICIGFAFLIVSGCHPNNESDGGTERARESAQEFLALVRSQQWEEAARFCLIDESARRTFNLSGERDDDTLRDHLARLFEGIYEAVPPGDIYSVELDPYDKGDETFARVTYVAGDFDTFNMRFVDGRWMYTFDSGN